MQKGEVYKLDNLLTAKEIRTLNQILENLTEESLKVKDNYGRRIFEEVEIPAKIVKKLTKLANRFSDRGTKLELLYPVNGAEYSLNYRGEPNLPPHFDGDFNDIIIDYQLASSSDLETQWPLGVNLETYPLQDNQALIFNPNANIHWRPIRAFKEGEYVRMFFFRFYNPANPSDYSHLPNHPQDRVFDGVTAYRNYLAQISSEL